ncbi:flagellar FliJ protein [Desulfosarcina sp. BuS5]|uniref:flagellar export protein FliJ n=1 Tax=Desulfosarcina sp. BuS5 TaxID=933262 RepID=UPI000550BC6D|nr:flagellar export protein FliJ [Desulfosarcina sp. BuS5]WDN90044.1 flagellar FliJ protein [Desulfosarcina sp. BuS5]
MYHFTLEALLSHRKSIEESFHKELADSQRLLKEEMNKKMNFEQEREKVMTELERKTSRGITAGDNFIYHNFIQRLAADIDKQDKRLLGVEREVESKRIVLLEAVKNRKALEKLKEKGLEAYARKLGKKEQRFINEVAVNNFFRSVTDQKKTIISERKLNHAN